jgi:hypothetical protein
VIKYLTSLDTNWGEQSATLIEAHSRGVDHNWLIQKTAGEQREWLRDIKPVDGHELIHLLAVGDTEFFGYNRNADGFSEADNERCHHRFVKDAHLFRNHKNKFGKDPDFGYPVASYHHPDMKRIELVVAANKKTAGDIIHEVASGRDAAFSMGANMVHDVCTICGNKARTAKKHCEHGKRPMLGRVLADGRICALDNPNPYYVDISKVVRPAERTAYSVKLLKAASEGFIAEDDVIGGAERAEMLGIVLPDSFQRAEVPLQKWAALQALASIEKHIPAIGHSLADTLPAELDDNTESAVRDEILKSGGLKRVMENLHGRGILLKPKQFFRITIGSTNTSNSIEPIMDEISAALRDVFSRGLADGGGDFAEDGRFDGGDCDAVCSCCGESLDRAKPKSTLDEPEVNTRVIRNAMVNPGKQHRVVISKKASSTAPGVAARGYAELYAAYQLAFASHPHNHRSTLVKQAVALVNAQEP